MHAFPNFFYIQQWLWSVHIWHLDYSPFIIRDSWQYIAPVPCPQLKYGWQPHSTWFKTRVLGQYRLKELLDDTETQNTSFMCYAYYNPCIFTQSKQDSSLQLTSAFSGTYELKLHMLHLMIWSLKFIYRIFETLLFHFTENSISVTNTNQLICLGK